MTTTSAPHDFIAPQSTDSRSPCPALNALANHGYLPRDGKNINVFRLVGALRRVYGVSLPLATILSSGGIYLCGHGTKLDLAGLQKHDVIEHDGSLVHRDLNETGGTEPTFPDSELIDAIIKSSDGHVVTLENLIQYKQIRESRVNINSLADYPNGLLAHFSRGEPVLIVSVMGESNTGISVERARTWLGEERLPEGFVPRQTTGMLGLRSGTNRLITEVDALHAQIASERRNE